jgi:hypothetical protein
VGPLLQACAESDAADRLAAVSALAYVPTRAEHVRRAIRQAVAPLLDDAHPAELRAAALATLEAHGYAPGPAAAAEPEASDFASWQKRQPTRRPPASAPAAAPAEPFTERVVADDGYTRVVEYAPGRFKVVQTAVRANVTPEAVFTRKWNATMDAAEAAARDLPELEAAIPELEAKLQALKARHDDIEEKYKLQVRVEEAREAAVRVDVAGVAAVAAREEAAALRSAIERAWVDDDGNVRLPYVGGAGVRVGGEPILDAVQRQEFRERLRAAGLSQAWERLVGLGSPVLDEPAKEWARNAYQSRHPELTEMRDTSQRLATTQLRLIAARAAIAEAAELRAKGIPPGIDVDPAALRLHEPLDRGR